ncbi:MAG: signal peptidase I [Verrucomicrobiota bacterium]
MELPIANTAAENDAENSATIAAPAAVDYRGLFKWAVKHAAIYLVVAVATYVCFRFSNRYLVQTVQIQGCSMLPTLADAQCYLLNRAAYLLREPAPTDIVVLRDPETNGYAIKRVIAKPGDAIFVEGGKLFVNGQLVSEPYLKPGTKTYPAPDIAPRCSSVAWISTSF